MGNWGSNIFDNDLTQDIKDSFEELIVSGFPVKQIISHIKDEQHYDELEVVEKHFFWVAAAITVWNHGYKDKQIFSKGLNSIDALMIDFGIDESLHEELKQYKTKLLIEPVKIKRKREYYVCPWKIGDVYALEITKDAHLEDNLNGRYLIFIKRDEYTYQKNVYPIVEIKITKDHAIPRLASEINELEFVMPSYLFPYAVPMIKRLEKKNGSYVRNEIGLYPQTYFKIKGDMLKDIPSNIIFINNYPQIEESRHSNRFMKEEDKFLYFGGVLEICRRDID